MTHDDFEAHWRIYEEECFFHSLYFVSDEEPDTDADSGEFEDE
jgi:hypothetical protein